VTRIPVDGGRDGQLPRRETIELWPAKLWPGGAVFALQCRLVQAVGVRGFAVRALSCLFAASWLVVPGFGLIDLSVTWNAEWPQVLEAGWGLFATVIVAAAFVRVAAWPRTAMPGVAQLMVATVSLAIAALVAKETKLFALVVFLGLQTAIVGAVLGVGRLTRAEPDGARSRSPRLLLVVAAAGAVPWLSYALHMWTLNREGRSDGDVSLGIDHYSVQGALALVLVLLPVSAALRADLRPFVAVCAGVAASYLGLVSLAWPDAAGALGRAWSVAALAWGLALVAATFCDGFRLASLRGRPAD
jgi:hypothetical protein